ncbi:hypothetical protein [Pseudotabrizicola alkalilacus]|nr:hypothetical protein [Pseudotabrizicola alkalilacus]
MFLVPEGQKAPPEEITDAASVAFRVYLAFFTEEFARISGEHRDLVLLRNNLVHQFLKQEDLRTVEGCLTAQRTLTQALKRISFAYDGLRGWVLEKEHARQAFMDQLALPDLQNFLVHCRIPWHLATITTALNEASVALAKGDWTPVDAAANWIAERHPEEQPGGYGCRTWRQVIHEAGQFDL